MTGVAEPQMMSRPTVPMESFGFKPAPTMTTDVSPHLSPQFSDTVAELVESRLHSGEVCLIIESDSMRPTLEPGDQVMVRRARISCIWATSS